MTTNTKALDRLVDAIAGSDVSATPTVTGEITALATALKGSDVTLEGQTVATRIDELAAKIESGEITIGGGGGGAEFGAPIGVSLELYDGSINSFFVTGKTYDQTTIASVQEDAYAFLSSATFNSYTTFGANTKSSIIFVGDSDLTANGQLTNFGVIIYDSGHHSVETHNMNPADVDWFALSLNSQAAMIYANLNITDQYASEIPEGGMMIANFTFGVMK